MEEYKELEELINGYITDKNIRIKKLKDNLDQVSAELDQVSADCEKALMGNNEKKYASLKAQTEMLSARKAQAQRDLDKLVTAHAIPEETYKDLTSQIRKKQNTVYWDCKREIADHYNQCKALVKEKSDQISEGNRLLWKIDNELYKRVDSSGVPVRTEIRSTVDLDKIVRDMRDALRVHYAVNAVHIPII